MFNREANDLKDYTSTMNIEFSENSMDTDELRKNIERFNAYTLPEIKEQILATQKKDNAYFVKKHNIRKEQLPIGTKVMIKNVDEKKAKPNENFKGPYFVSGYTEHGSYILKNKINQDAPRNYPIDQLKIIDVNPTDSVEEEKDTYEVDRIIDHRGRGANIEYLTTWVGYPDEQTWLKPTDFDSNTVINEYWTRRRKESKKQKEAANTSQMKRRSTNRHNDKKSKKFKRT
ncbi:hypothetical protein BDF20DRAFT_814801 [Mycotypha africana]|uniref:uncharacterized protein n=1 Tax=Mycotypha africana TaxID=64632 RepID=UPI002300CD48|nr:uncharacterized protein BDF20DRAFT_814801 [Mycotypha africana]KAI8987933.1 hypothetical protein BDF20DRAFT_814801 [Mycotypha africana]